MDLTETPCPNCGAARSNRFCSVCGQNDRDYSQSLLSVLAVAFRETLELDSRVARTLRDITIHPGRPSAEFARNRRAKYVTPFRLYLFSSLLCFFMVSLIPEPLQMGQDDQTPTEHTQSGPDLVLTVEDQSNARNVDRLIPLLSAKHATMVRELLQRDATMIKPLLRGLAARLPDDATSDDLYISIAEALIEMVDSPERAVEKLFDNLPLMMFALLPWFGVLLALFYFRSHMRFVYHLVFAMHLHSFAFILFSAAMLFGFLLSQLPDDHGIWQTSSRYLLNLVSLGFLIHMWLSFKTFYGQSILATTLKFLGISTCYWLMLGPAFLIVIVFTIFQFM